MRSLCKAHLPPDALLKLSGGINLHCLCGQWVRHLSKVQKTQGSNPGPVRAVIATLVAPCQTLCVAGLEHRLVDSESVCCNLYLPVTLCYRVRAQLVDSVYVVTCTCQTLCVTGIEHRLVDSVYVVTCTFQTLCVTGLLCTLVDSESVYCNFYLPDTLCYRITVYTS